VTIMLTMMTIILLLLVNRSLSTDAISLISINNSFSCTHMVIHISNNIVYYIILYVLFPTRNIDSYKETWK